MNFDDAFVRLIGHEGGYTNNPKDPGGETKFGISKRSYPQLSIADLCEYDAKVIYRRDYWDKCRADSLPPEVRFDVFDTAVNSGIGQAVKFLQAAVGVSVDGVLGPITLSAVNMQPGYITSAKFNGFRLDFMTRLATWPTFSAGWARRIASNLVSGA